MPTYAWVAIGMLVAGSGGALATRESMRFMGPGLEAQSPEVLGNLAALGGVLAGLCGGLASIGRGHTADRNERLGGVAALSIGLLVVAALDRAYLYSPLLVVMAPLQGLAALLGGFVALAALWTVLQLVGIGPGSDRVNPFRGSAPTPLSTTGLLAIALSFVVPAFPWVTDSLGVISNGLFFGGLLLYGTSRLLHGGSLFRNRDTGRGEPATDRGLRSRDANPP